MPNPHPSIGGIRFILGGNVFGWQLNRDESFAIMDTFYEMGGRMIDTAEGYSAWVPGNTGGESEALIGEWMESRGVRKDMLIGTKTGMGAPPGALAPAVVANALQGSLERLRSDYIDLYYAHYDDGTTPLEEVVSGYNTAIRAGKVREIGASNYSAQRLEAVVRTANEMGAIPFTVLQPEYNLVTRDSFEGLLQDYCVRENIAVFPYYSLASGFLSGKYTAKEDWAGSSRGFALDDIAARGGFSHLKDLQEVASELEATPAQVALAWLNTRKGIAAPLASATSIEQLKELVGCTQIALTSEQITKLEG